MVIVKVATLGSSGVGKTTLIAQFVRGEQGEPPPASTLALGVERCTVVVGDRIYELQLLDLPPLDTFPCNSLQEWDLCRTGQAVRLATAFLLVYDVSRLETFRSVVEIYEKLREYRPNAPLVVVAAKADLGASDDDDFSQLRQQIQQKKSVGAFGQQQLCQPTTSAACSPQESSRCWDSQRAAAIAATVRKQWKRPLIECSALKNWHVSAVFQELMANVESNSNHLRKGVVFEAKSKDDDQGNNCKLQ